MNDSTNLTGIIVGIILIILVVTGALYWYQKNQAMDATTNQNARGVLYIGVTDATTDLANVNEIALDIEKIEVHSQTQGWVTISDDAKSFDLLALNAEQSTKFYAKKDDMPSGIYDQVRMTLGEAMIETKTQGNIRAYMPGEEVTIPLAFSIGTTSTIATEIKLDILADQSLHTAADGKYLFTPVVKVDSQHDASITVSSDERLVTTGGTTGASVQVGVDLSGVTKMNYTLTPEANLRIDTASGTIKFINGSTSIEQGVQGMIQTNTSMTASTTGSNSINVGSGVNINL